MSGTRERAGSAADPAGQSPTSESPELAGHNRISTQALTSVAQAAAAETFGVQPSEVRVSFSDDAGQLAIALATPIRVPGLSSVLGDAGRVGRFGGSIWQRTIAAKKGVLDQVGYLTGSQISNVDIRITGVRQQHKGGLG